MSAHEHVVNKKMNVRSEVIFDWTLAHIADKLRRKGEDEGHEPGLPFLKTTRQQRWGEAMLSRLNSGLMGIAGLVCLAMTIHISVDVVAKYLFKWPVPLTYEIVSVYYMVALVFLPLAFTEQKDRHISVELVVDRLPVRVRWFFNSFAEMLAAIFLAILAWRTAIDAWGKFVVSESTVGSVSMPAWPSYFFLPVGCGAAAAAFALKSLHGFRAHSTGGTL
jgi:TRAP-type C4-dicarboxylate transport system permease small subunit